MQCDIEVRSAVIAMAAGMPDGVPSIVIPRLESGTRVVITEGLEYVDYGSISAGVTSQTSSPFPNVAAALRSCHVRIVIDAYSISTWLNLRVQTPSGTTL